jgi:hypothetical protein
MLEGKTSLTGTPAALTPAQIERAYFGAQMTSASPHQEDPA